MPSLGDFEAKQQRWQLAVAKVRVTNADDAERLLRLRAQGCRHRADRVELEEHFLSVKNNFNNTSAAHTLHMPSRTSGPGVLAPGRRRAMGPKRSWLPEPFAAVYRRGYDSFPPNERAAHSSEGFYRMRASALRQPPASFPSDRLSSPSTKAEKSCKPCDRGRTKLKNEER